MAFQKLQNFLLEVISELKKVSWATRRELIDATFIVILSSAILCFFIGSIDVVLSKFLEFIIR